MADAGQDTGEEDAKVTPTDTGEQQQSGDADPGQDGQKGERKIDPQAIRDAAFKEARETFQPKIKELETTVDELRGRLEGGKPSKDEDADLQSQIDEVKRSHQEQIQSLQSKIEKANAATARAKLVEALHETGVVKPELVAEVLAKRVRADVVEDSLTVLTEEGGKALNKSTAEPMTVQDLAREFAEQNPELVRDRQQAGSGFARGEAPAPKSLDDRIADARKRGNQKEVDLLTMRKVVGSR